MEIPKPEKKNLPRDLAGGVTVAMVSIPEGMAYALIAGVDPIYGLYAGMLTVIVGSLFASTQLMVVTLTNAVALIVVDNLGLLGEDIAVGIASLTLMVGLVQFALGVLKLGRLIRFISHDVMAGFIAAVAAIIIFGHIGELVGYHEHLEVGEHISGRVVEGIIIIISPWHWDPATAATGFLTIALLVFLKRTTIKRYADIVVIGAVTILVAAFGLSSVLIVQDFSEIPANLPGLVTPDPGLMPDLFPAAIAIAIIALVESAGVRATFKNPDKSKSSQSQDFSAQGLGNIAGCFIAALPGGGSISLTEVNKDAGSITRFGGVLAGAIVILAVALFGPVFEFIPMAGLAGLLIFIGFVILAKEIPRMLEAWETSKAYSISMLATFVVSIGYSLEVGIVLGIILSIALYVYFSAKDAQLIVLEPLEDRQFRVRPVPKELQSDEITIIQQQGTRYFAAIHTMEDELPDWRKTTNAT
ncbi:MAG: hypothetical protein GQ558_02505, partial [Thermoplasmata archaeon]|nr:hypothetical protein [Thermoplasmata archaeon]